MNIRLCRSVAVALSLCASQATARSKLPPLPTTEDAAAQDRLLVPTSAPDHSAFRMDTEVFGWSADLTEVAAVVMEVARGPKGKHRGETYMLVYGVDEWIPKHNVITHNITHADLPHAPVPLQEAKDFLWTIEFSYQHMWPHRPRRARGPADMKVEPVWASVPTAEPGICRPWMSTRLTHQRQTRLMPYRPIDLTTRCSLLRTSDTRTYWASPTLAASMVRFDFAARTRNEESARFLVSSRWAHAKRPSIEVHAPAAVRQGATSSRLLHALSALAPTTFAPSSTSPAGDTDIDGGWEADVEGGHDWLPVAVGALDDVGISLGRVVAVDGPLRAKTHSAPSTAPPPAPDTLARQLPVQASRLQGALTAARSPLFGHDAAGATGEMPGRLPAGLASESGMVDDIVTQHDPIEDAFDDEPPPPYRPGRTTASVSASPPSPANRGRARSGTPKASPYRLRVTLRRKGAAPVPAPDDAARGARRLPTSPSPAVAPGPNTPPDSGRYLEGWAP